MWFVSWYIIYPKSAPSNTSFFPLIFATESYFTSESILFFIAACTIFAFMNYFTIFYGLLLNQLINLTSVFIMLFGECFSTFFKYILHAFYKQKRPCKARWSVYMGIKRPAKARSRFYESEISVRWENLFLYKQILISNRILL